jgi:heme exporter protein B
MPHNQGAECLMTLVESTRSWWWLVHKDLLRELRAPRIWPGMLLLGIVLALVIAMQIDQPREQRANTVGGLYWLTAFFAGTIALDRSFAGERDDGCWQGLLLYPVAPATVFLAKLAVNLLALCCLDLALVPAFILFTDIPLLHRPGPFLAIMLLANLGFSAVGTIVSALMNGMRERGGLLVLLLLPLISPVILGAAQATRLLVVGDAQSDGWRWMQLLSGFAILFVAIGSLLFEFVIEE